MIESQKNWNMMIFLYTCFDSVSKPQCHMFLLMKSLSPLRIIEQLDKVDLVTGVFPQRFLIIPQARHQNHLDGQLELFRLFQIDAV